MIGKREIGVWNTAVEQDCSTWNIGVESVERGTWE
jgi:hypothetical protein